MLPTADTSQLVLIERIDGVRLVVNKIDETQDELQKCVTQLIEAGSHHQKTIDDHEKRLRALENAINPLIVLSKIMAAFAVLLAGSIVALIWAIIIGQAVLTFP